MKKWIPVLAVLLLAPTLRAHGMSEADKLAMVAGGNLKYLWLGAVHMVTGYDHLLFLFGVIFYLTGLKDILKFVTAFTLGHSVTLILATFLHITANAFLVDAVIALSVCYKAFDNLDGFRKYLKVGPPHLLAMIVVFGLIHGFGLSTRLQQLPLPVEGLIWRILSFNLGVELGQVLALIVLVALLAGLRRTAAIAKVGRAANLALLAAGVGLFIYQINGFLRGDAHHEGEHGHEAAEEGHSHGPGGHTHGNENATQGEAPHSHDAGSHSHAGKAHTHAPKPTPAPSAPPADSAPPAPAHKHSHGGHSHSHGTDQGPPPKRPSPPEPSADTLGGAGIP
jgi:hypothetical protein